MTDKQTDAQEAEKLQEQNAYREAILENFTDPMERKVVQQQMQDMGVDLSDGPLDGEENSKVVDAIQKAADDEQAAKLAAEEAAKKVAQEAADGKADDKTKADGKTKDAGGETQTEAEDDAAAKQGDGGEEPEWKAAIAELRKEMTSKDRQIAELQAKNDISASEVKIRKEVSDAMAGVLAKNQAEDKEIDAKVAKHAEDYGEEAANELKAQIEANRKLRDQQVERQAEDEYAKRKAMVSKQINSQSRVEQAIAGNSDIAGWRNENGLNWTIAKAIDAHLMDQPEWKEKTLDERFTEVVRLVKERTQAASPGTLEPPAVQTEADKRAAEKKSAADILAEARAKAKEKEAPKTLSDIHGEQSDSGQGLTFDKMEGMNAADLWGSVAAMGTEGIDRLMQAESDKFYRLGD